MTTSEKVAYLKGLVDGLGIEMDKKEGKVLASIIDILSEVASDIEDLEANSYELGEAIDQVSDDLSDIEDIVYDLDDDEDFDFDDEDEEEYCGGCCCGSADEDEDPVFYEVTCPGCENSITIDEDVLALGAIQCPNCGETLEFIGLEGEDDEESTSDEE